MNDTEKTNKPGKPKISQELRKRNKAFAEFIGRKVREAKEASGLTREEFADKRLGVSVAAYYQITSGRVSVSYIRAHELLAKIETKSRFFAGEDEFIYSDE
jgi:transcriptional regulator with XRE-family HTH domain